MIDEFLQYIDLSFRDIPTSLIVGMLLIFLVGTTLLLKFGGLRKGWRWSAVLLLLEYLFLLLFLSVLSRNTQAERVYDFVPFWSYRALMSGKRGLLAPIIANVVAFVPVGFFLGCAFGRIKWWRVLLIGGSFSILIETLQFVLKRGHTEVDDVVHNVAGCLVGYGVYLAFTHIVRSLTRKPSIDTVPTQRR